MGQITFTYFPSILTFILLLVFALDNQFIPLHFHFQFLGAEAANIQLIGEIALIDGQFGRMVTELEIQGRGILLS
jgi:uncharacterized integral membrane protein